jgi:hypothetical protein
LGWRVDPSGGWFERRFGGFFLTKRQGLFLHEKQLGYDAHCLIVPRRLHGL